MEKKSPSHPSFPARFPARFLARFLAHFLAQFLARLPGFLQQLHISHNLETSHLLTLTLRFPLQRTRPHAQMDPWRQKQRHSLSLRIAVAWICLSTLSLHQTTNQQCQTVTPQQKNQLQPIFPLLSQHQLSSQLMSLPQLNPTDLSLQSLSQTQIMKVEVQAQSQLSLPPVVSRISQNQQVSSHSLVVHLLTH